MEDTRAVWYNKYAEALEHDAWGQVEEAVETYERLQVAAAAEQEENVLQLPANRRAAIGHLATVLEMRLEEVKGFTSCSSSGAGAAPRRPPRVGLAGMQALKPFVNGLITTDVQLPPALLAVVTGSQGACTGGPPPQWPRRASAGGAALVARDDEDTASAPEAGQGWAAAAAGGPGLAAAAAAAAVSGRALGGRESFGRGPGAENGTLRAPPEGLVPGDAALSIFIDSWFIKGADALRDASVVVSVRGARGQLLEAVQETPPPASAAEQQLRWGVAVHIQTPLAELGDCWSIVLELRHWKAAKKKRSTKAWCLLESDEVAPLLNAGPRGRGGAANSAGASGDGHRKALEAYAKPPRYAKAAGAPKLLSSKPLYLHTALHVRRC